MIHVHLNFWERCGGPLHILDIGTSTIRGWTLTHKITWTVNAFVSQPLQGYDGQKVLDTLMFQTCLQQVVRFLEVQSGWTIYRLWILIGGGHLWDMRFVAFSAVEWQSYLLDPSCLLRKIHPVTTLCGYQVLEAPVVQAIQDFLPLHDKPQRWIMTLSVMTPFYDQVKGFLAHTGIECAGMLCSVWLEAQMLLSAPQRHIGTACVHMGALSTVTTFWKHGVCVVLKVVAWGGDHITAQLCEVFHLTWKTANNIKQQYGLGYHLWEAEGSFQTLEHILNPHNRRVPQGFSSLLVAFQKTSEKILSSVTAHLKEFQELCASEALSSSWMFCGRGSYLQGMAQYVWQHFPRIRRCFSADQPCSLLLFSKKNDYKIDAEHVWNIAGFLNTVYFKKSFVFLKNPHVLHRKTENFLYFLLKKLYNIFN